MDGSITRLLHPGRGSRFIPAAAGQITASIIRAAPSTTSPFTTSSRRDGETRIDGGPVSPLTDLRGKLTQIPAGCEATGWTVGPENDGHVTMMFFDPALISEDLGRLYEASPIQPKLYFEDPDIADALTRLDRLLQDGEDLADLYPSPSACSSPRASST